MTAPTEDQLLKDVRDALASMQVLDADLAAADCEVDCARGVLADMEDARRVKREAADAGAKRVEAARAALKRFYAEADAPDLPDAPHIASCPGHDGGECVCGKDAKRPADGPAEVAGERDGAEWRDTSAEPETAPAATPESFSVIGDNPDRDADVSTNGENVDTSEASCSQNTETLTQADPTGALIDQLATQEPEPLSLPPSEQTVQYVDELTAAEQPVDDEPGGEMARADEPAAPPADSPTEGEAFRARLEERIGNAGKSSAKVWHDGEDRPRLIDNVPFNYGGVDAPAMPVATMEPEPKKKRGISLFKREREDA